MTFTFHFLINKMCILQIESRSSRVGLMASSTGNLEVFSERTSHQLSFIYTWSSFHSNLHDLENKKYLQTIGRE